MVAAKTRAALCPYPYAVQAGGHSVRKLSRQLGVRIRRLRESRNRTQAWLAAQIGVHVNTISRWERDGISLDHRALPRIAIALDCLAELLVVLRRLRWRARPRARSRARGARRSTRSCARVARASTRPAARHRALASRSARTSIDGRANHQTWSRPDFGRLEDGPGAKARAARAHFASSTSPTISSPTGMCRSAV
jgi:transcriptional regulator with XRE-family HTH domain